MSLAVTVNQDDMIIKCLRETFGHQNFRSPLQEIAVREACTDFMENFRDLMCIMATGSGKSLIYQLPALLNRTKPRVSIVICPILALITDQVEKMNLIKRGCATRLDSRMSKSERDKVFADLKKPIPTIKLVFTTPEQVMNKAVIELTENLMLRDKLNFVAVDEFHCISEWGHSFRPSYLSLVEFRKLTDTYRWILLTATASPSVRSDAAKILRLRDVNIISNLQMRKNIRLEVEEIDLGFSASHSAKIMANLSTFIKANLTESPESRGIVYVFTREETRNISRILCDHGISSVGYHAKMDQKERAESQVEWMRGKYRVIVATIAFGMGIDQPAVRVIVHWGVSSQSCFVFPRIWQGREGRSAGSL